MCTVHSNSKSRAANAAHGKGATQASPPVANPEPRGEPAPSSCVLPHTWARAHVPLTYYAHTIGTFSKRINGRSAHSNIYTFYLPMHGFPLETVFLYGPNSKLTVNFASAFKDCLKTGLLLAQSNILKGKIIVASISHECREKP